MLARLLSGAGLVLCGVMQLCGVSCRRFGQAIKGVWWMPWGKKPKKGAVSGETRR